MASRDCLLVAAIDFGTTYSGWAFSFKHEFKTDPKKVNTRQWMGPTMVTAKAPTTLLIRPDGTTLDSFGYEAERKFAEMEPDDRQKWYYFRHFKMILYGNKVDSSLLLKDETNKTLPAKTVFSEAIRYLREDILKVVKDGLVNGEVEEEEIMWILTVPAIWNDAAKQFMREAAVEAGMKGEGLKIALEPEAASIFCQLIPLQKHKDGISPFKRGSKYMVLDAGGGTVDITIHEVQARGRLKELHRANGGGWGGISVDQAFETFLIRLVGESVFQRFCQENQEDYQAILGEFEIKKRKADPESNADVKIRLPMTFLKALEKTMHAEKVVMDEKPAMNPSFLERILRTFRLPLLIRGIFVDRTDNNFRFEEEAAHILSNEECSLKYDKLIINASIMNSFFSEAIENIVSHMKNLMKEENVNGISAILMVGGFSESKVLQHAIKSNFLDVETIIPPEAMTVVLKGAVVYGHDPSVITKRVCKYTYGVSSVTVFNEDTHDRSKQVMFGEKLFCKDIFSKHVEIGQTVTFNKRQSKRWYNPVTEDAEKIQFEIYGSTEKSPMYVTDNGCVKLGKVTIEVSDRSVPLEDRNFFVFMTFSGTEIEVAATEQRTGKSTNVYVDFLDLK